MKCQIITIRPKGETAGSETHFCRAHDWSILRATVEPGYLCPLGRIEAARDVALGEIEQTAKNIREQGYLERKG